MSVFEFWGPTDSAQMFLLAECSAITPDDLEGTI